MNNHNPTAVFEYKLVASTANNALHEGPGGFSHGPLEAFVRQKEVDMQTKNPQRSAGEGAFVDPNEIQDFLAHCAAKGLKTREHSGWPVQEGYQVRYQGHWMALCWNKNWKRYTADKRLGEIVDQFVAKRNGVA